MLTQLKLGKKNMANSQLTQWLNAATAWLPQLTEKTETRLNRGFGYSMNSARHTSGADRGFLYLRDILH